MAEKAEEALKVTLRRLCGPEGPLQGAGWGPRPSPGYRRGPISDPPMSPKSPLLSLLQDK